MLAYKRTRQPIRCWERQGSNSEPHVAQAAYRSPNTAWGRSSQAGSIHDAQSWLQRGRSCFTPQWQWSGCHGFKQAAAGVLSLLAGRGNHLAYSWKAANPPVQQLGALVSDRSLSSAQQWEVKWGRLCPTTGLYLGLGVTIVSKKQQQELRDGAEEKEKAEQGSLNTNQTGNLKLPSFHEHTTTEVLSWSRNLKTWLPRPGAGPRSAASSRTHALAPQHTQWG